MKTLILFSILISIILLSGCVSGGTANASSVDKLDINDSDFSIDDPGFEDDPAPIAIDP